MPFVPVPNAVLAELRMTQDSQEIENTLWFRFETDPTSVLLEQLAADLLQWWIDSYADICSDEVELREVVCTDQSSATGPQASLPAPIGANGNLTGNTLPNSNSLTVSFRTNNRGRSFRGRNYIAGLTVGVVVENNAVPGYMASVVAAYETLLPSGGALTSGTWVVASRFSGVDGDGKPVPRVTGVTTPITSVVIVDSIVDSQRRRLPGRGK